MALSFFDTFEYGTTVDTGWDAGSAGTYTSTGGPFNTRYLSNPGSNGTGPAKTLGSNVTTAVLGFWFNHSNAFGTARVLWKFIDVATAQCSLGIDTAGKLTVRNGTAGTVHATATNALTQSAWAFIECKVVFGNSGSMEVKVDGTQVINATSVDTTATANNYCTIIQWGFGNLSGIGIDDVYMLDTTGSAPTNDFLGPVKGYLLTPTGSDTGNYNQWTASASTRTSCVDETPTSNGDTDYVSDNTAGHKQSFTLTDTAAGIGTIYGTYGYMAARRDDAGPHTGRQFLRIGGADYVEATETFSASYASYAYMRAVSPATGVAWTASELDGTEIGVELVT